MLLQNIDYAFQVREIEASYILNIFKPTCNWYLFDLCTIHQMFTEDNITNAHFFVEKNWNIDIVIPFKIHAHWVLRSFQKVKLMISCRVFFINIYQMQIVLNSQQSNFMIRLLYILKPTFFPKHTGGKWGHSVTNIHVLIFLECFLRYYMIICIIIM